MSLAQKAARGAAWTILTSFGGRAIGVIGTLVMTRLVTPDIIGEVSVASIIALTASWLTTWGFGQYAIVKGRGNDAEALEITFHATVAYVVLGIIALGTISLASGALTSFVHPAIIVTFIPGMALSVFINRIGAMPEKVLARQMKFRIIGLKGIAGDITFGVSSVFLAWRGWGANSIIIGNILQATVMTSILIAAVGLKPWLTPSRLKWSRFRDMLKFGLPLGLQTTAHMGARYWDNVLIDHLFGAGRTGLYNQAYNLADIPAIQIGEQLAQVLMPSMASLPQEQRPRALERSSALLSLIIFPLAVGLGLVAKPLIAIVLPPTWQEVAPLLTILTVLSVFRPITWVLSAYFEANSRTAQLMWLEVAKLAMLLAGIYFMAPLGLRYSASAVGVAYGINAIAGVWMVSREGVSGWKLLVGFAQPLAACAFMAGAVIGIDYALRNLLGVQNPVALLVPEIIIGGLAYVATALVICRTTARDLLGLLRGMRNRRKKSASDAP